MQPHQYMTHTMKERGLTRAEHMHAHTDHKSSEMSDVYACVCYVCHPENPAGLSQAADWENRGHQSFKERRGMEMEQVQELLITRQREGEMLPAVQINGFCELKVKMQKDS